MLHTVCYISNAVSLWQHTQLENLFSYTKKQNVVMDVTGLLLYNEGTFVQVLEGEGKIVHSLFSKIKSDKRHNQITLMMDREIDQRLFNSYQANSVTFGNLKELKKLKLKVQLPKASKYTKSIWAILRPFYALRQGGIMGYGV